MKKLLSSCLCCVMVLTSISMNSYAVEDELPVIVSESESESERETLVSVIETESDILMTDIYEEPVLFELKSQTGCEKFVSRLYKECLGRDVDQSGLNYWTSTLINKEKTGISVAYGFVFSDELKNQNLCNGCFIELLYRALMGREYDQGGKEAWLNYLKQGNSREALFNEFAMSQEFKGICTTYGILVGEAISVPQRGTVAQGDCSKCHAESGVVVLPKNWKGSCKRLCI